MEQFACRQHNRRIPELVEAVEKESRILIALCRSSAQPFSGLLTIRRDIPPQEIQLAQGVLCKLISLISGGCQVCKCLCHILRHGLAGEINLSEPIPCKLAAMVCGLAQPFHCFYCTFLCEEQLSESVLREIITGFCGVPKPLLRFFVVTQGREIIPIELTKLMCRNGISFLPELLQRFDCVCMFRIQRIDVLQNGLCSTVSLRLLVHAVG